jgi:hypothetical protein
MKLTGQMNHFLAGMEYPARPSDLIREALREGFTDDDVITFAMLDERSYHGAFDVRRSMSRQGSLISSVA